MFTKTTLLALAAASAVQAAAPQGFNYGSKMGETPVTGAMFKAEFEKAQALANTSGSFNAARLYTMLSGEDGTSVIPALQAAIDTKTHLLLGLWTSGDPAGFTKELNALKEAVKTMPDLGQYILGISVGSEDLYRDSDVGRAKPGAGPGQSPDTLVSYIKQVRDAISQNSAWSDVKVGHVDTWTAWVNGSVSAVIENSDFLGVDAYPYWQSTVANGVENGKKLFDEAMDATRGAANGKPLWITETGWPVVGGDSGAAVANDKSAQTFWQEVGCPNFGNTPTFWYTLYDGLENAVNITETPSFSVAHQNGTARFDLSCSNVSKDNNNTSSSNNSTSSNGSSSSGTSTGTAAKSTGTGSASSGSSNGTYTGSLNTPSGTSGSGTGSGSSGTGASGSGTSSGSGSTGSGAPATGSAATLSISLGSMAALAAGVVALL